MNTEVKLVDVLSEAQCELTRVSIAVQHAMTRLSEAPDPELRTTAKVMCAFQRGVTRRQQRIAQRVQLLQLESEGVVGDGKRMRARRSLGQGNPSPS